MNVLFFVEPRLELGKSSFRFGALRNQVLRVSLRLKAAGHEVTVLAGEGAQHALASSPQARAFEDAGIPIAVVSLSSLSRRAKSSATILNDLHVGKLTDAELDEYGSAIWEPLDQDYYPDVILTWESSVPHLRRRYPEALVWHMMPGFFSRVPFPELLSLDPCGFFQNSVLAGESDFFRQLTASPQDADFLNAVRAAFLERFLAPNNPFPRIRLDPTQRFSRLLLLPLQVSGYFAFDSTSPYRNSLDFILDVLGTVSPSIGVVVTQYITPHTSDRVLTGDNLSFLRDRFPNLLYNPEFDKVEGVSQYLLGSVDGVACVSSSIGFQALLWKKPIFVFGNSHLSPFSQGTSGPEIADALEKPAPNFDGALHFLLTRMQPLLIGRCYESDWFVGFIERSHRRYRQGARGLDLFETIDTSLPSYTREFLSASKVERARQRLNQAQLERTLTHSPASLLSRKVVHGKHTIVTFDIFDTLICRPFARPVDLFALIGDQVARITAGAVPNFMQLRVGSEAACRKRKRSDNQGVAHEVSLAEIYQELADQLGIDHSLRDRMMRLEMETEARLLQRRALGVQAFQTAIEAGVPVYLVSDMYLPKHFVEAVLARLEISGYEELLLSSDIGVRKHEGELFDHLVKVTGVSPNSILHIGDNPHGDRDVPRQKGLRAILAPSAIANVYSHKMWGPCFRRQRSKMTLSQSMALGVTANRLFSEPNSAPNSHFFGNLQAIGYLGLGWMVVGMVQWLIHRAREDRIDTLYFLSRDGEILLDTFRQLAPAHARVPEAKYLLSSRRAAQVAGLLGREDIAAIALSPFRSGSGREFLEQRFGLDDSALAEVDAARLDAEVGGQAGNTTRVQLALSLEGPILANARRERGAYQAYLKEQGLGGTGRAAIVDIGYAGSMQKALLRMTNRKQLGGYYFMTFASARPLAVDGQICRGYVTEFVEQATCLHPLARHGLMFEVMLSNSQPSLKRFGMAPDGRPTPESQPHYLSAEMRRFQRGLREGLSAFTTDLVEAFGSHLEQFDLDADTALLPLTQLFDAPTAADAECFVGVTFDDDFGGAGLRYAVGPSDSSASNDSPDPVWPAGLRATRSKKLRRTNEPSVPEKRSPSIARHLLAPLIRLLSSSSKRRKYERDPVRFHMDSRFAFVRWMSRFY